MNSSVGLSDLIPYVDALRDDNRDCGRRQVSRVNLAAIFAFDNLYDFMFLLCNKIAQRNAVVAAYGLFYV